MVRRANRKYHDRVAARYDDMYDTQYWRFYREVSWRHLRRFLPAGRPAWAADLGCGTGGFGARLLKAGLHTLFLDPSPVMLEYCVTQMGTPEQSPEPQATTNSRLSTAPQLRRTTLERARRVAEAESRRGLDTRFVQAGLEDLHEIGDGSLDFATAQGDPLSFCGDALVALRELRRCLAPVATLVLSVDSRVAGVCSLLREGRAGDALALLRSGRTTWRGERAGERFPLRMFDPDELDQCLRHTGFTPLSRIAKTCLVQRRDEERLQDQDLRRELLAAEESIHAQPHWFGAASHFQVAARRDP